MSPYYDFWRMMYTNQWCTLEALKGAVTQKLITPEEFKMISGQDYIA